MLRKIKTIEDLKAELFRYFEVMRALPAPKKPSYSKNYLWEMAKIDVTSDVADDIAARLTVTAEDVVDCWYVCDHWMPLLTKFEYNLLAARLRDKPVPWKLLEVQHHTSRQMLNIYVRKALKNLFDVVKE